MEQFTEALRALVPGVLGATSSVTVLVNTSLKRRAGMLLMSSSAAYYSYEYVANWLNIPSGLASFVVGLVTAPFLEKLVVEGMGAEWLRKVLGLKEEK